MSLHTRNPNQGALPLYCGDALKTSIINGLAIRGLHGNNCDGGTLFWITYKRSSGNLMLLHEILPQVMARKLLMILRVSMLLSRYRKTLVLQYVLVTLKCSQ
jgi:hypothetical protein